MSAYLVQLPSPMSARRFPVSRETLADLRGDDPILTTTSTGGADHSVGRWLSGAFGSLTPDPTNKAYLAPNTSFDYTLVEFQDHIAAEAEALWGQEWNAARRERELADRRLAVARLWSDPVVSRPWGSFSYTWRGIPDWIQRAYQSGAEFVTEADLASRIESFVQSDETIDGQRQRHQRDRCLSSHAGDFALDVTGQGNEVIANVGNWHAYDSNCLFSRETGGSFTITLGAAPDDVTHITSLPMRGDLLAVTATV